MKIKRKNTDRKYALVLVILSAFLLFTFYISFYIGRYTNIAFNDVFKILLNATGNQFFKATWSESAAVVMINLRFPRILAAMLVGAALPMAGACSA